MMSLSGTIARHIGLTLFEPQVSLSEFDDHEAVIFVQDELSDLKGFIAIHNTNRGPANGGTRFFSYMTEQDALRDALRLSRAMSYKSALAGLPYGGGKGVIMASPTHAKADQLRSYARRLALVPRFYTGEDVGLNADDIKLLAGLSPNIVGRPGIGDLPGHWAPLSVLVSMQAALSEAAGSGSLAGKTVAIKGMGCVGLALAQLLSAEGARIIAADIDDAQIARAKAAIPGISIASPEEIHTVKADVFAPCALGGDLHRSSIDALGARIVCGAANNQLRSADDAEYMHAQGVTYVPDYVANAGGLICVCAELHPEGFDAKRVRRDIERIGETVTHILRESKRRRVSTESIATAIARERIYGARDPHKV